eukprot:251843_1
MAMEEAAEQQAAAQVQAELQQQAEAEAETMRQAAEDASPPKKSTRKGKGKKVAKSNHQTALVGAVEDEQVVQEVTTAVDTDHLGLAETAMKFYVNKGKSVSLQKSAGTTEEASPVVSEQSALKKAMAPQAGISLVALGVRMSDAKSSANMPRVVSSHAYIVEGTRVGAMKKRANDLYHPLLLSTVSSPGSASSDAEGSA